MLLRRRLDSIHLLHVVRHDYARHTALGFGDAHSAVDQLADLRRLCRHMDIFAGNILEEGEQIDLLLILAAKCSARLLSDDGQHRLMVHLRVVEAIQQMDRARPRGGQAYAEIAGEFGVAAGHEGRHFLVPHLDEIELVAGAVEGADEAVDPVTGISKDTPYPPGGEPFPEEVAYCIGHAITFMLILLSNRAQSARRRSLEQQLLNHPTPTGNPLFQRVCGDVPSQC